MVLGITGGVGTGKSVILNYLKEKHGAVILEADEIAKHLLEPGQAGNREIRSIFPPELFAEDGQIRREEMAAYIFRNPEKRQEMNAIVFPLVKAFIQEEIAKHKPEELVVLEAALLIEEHYDEICHKMWYIYSSEENRRKRLKENRGYSEERIQAMFKSQLSEKQFKEGCDVVIDNDKRLEETYAQVEGEIQAWKDTMEI